MGRYICRYNTILVHHDSCFSQVGYLLALDQVPWPLIWTSFLGMTRASGCSLNMTLKWSTEAVNHHASRADTVVVGM